MDISAFWKSIGVSDPHGTGSVRQNFLLNLAREAGAAAGKAYAVARAANPAPHPILTHPLVGRQVEVAHSERRGVVESVTPDGLLTVAYDDGTATVLGRPSVRILPDAE